MPHCWALRTGDGTGDDGGVAAGVAVTNVALPSALRHHCERSAAIQRFGFSRYQRVNAAGISERMELDCHVGCASSQ